MKKDVIIIGAGASGLMCAIEAGRRGRSVLVVDHADMAGRKVLVSGGGRCNFTNTYVCSENYLSTNPHFCKSALSRFTPFDFITMLEKHGIRYYEKEAGQLFCDGRSSDILEMLQDECCKSSVEFLFSCRVLDLTKDTHFDLSTSLGVFQSESVVVATGGLSYPRLGATNMGYKIAQSFGISVTPLRPALVPFILNSQDLDIVRDLSGVSVYASINCKGKVFTGDMLFTHRGLSGPTVLQISSYWEPGDPISINLLPRLDLYQALLSRKSSRVELKNLLAEYLPRRFAHNWSNKYIQSKPLNQYSDKELRALTEKVHNWSIMPVGTEGYGKAEVTLGGVDTSELSSKSMEARKVPGLYFTGEVIDVTGQLGGYNLHWAWASGFAAGQHV